MELVEVEITGMAITHEYGALTTGDTMRVTPEFARHLVEDCNAAKYTSNKGKAKAEQEPEVQAEPAPEPAAEQAAATHEDEPAPAQKPAKKR